MSESKLTELEMQATKFQQAVRDVCQELQTFDWDALDTPSRLLTQAQCLMELVELRAKAQGKHLTDKKPFQLETLRLNRYLDKASTIRVQENRIKRGGESSSTTATGRVISHVLWTDLSKEQKAEFKVKLEKGKSRMNQ